MEKTQDLPAVTTAASTPSIETSCVSPTTTDNKEETKTLDKAKPVSANSFPSFDDWVDGLCSWKLFLTKAIEAESFQKLYTFLKTEYETKQISPSADLIFNAFKLTPITQVKVVILGMDPYHQPGQSMGLTFSVPKGVTIPPSLKNIFKSMIADPKVKVFNQPSHGDLTKWATQGVFLLCTILTVQGHSPNSHSKIGWEAFTDEVIDVVNKECDKVVFLLWGTTAQKKANLVNENKHLIINTPHPSPLSYGKGFETAYQFSKVNEYLSNNGKEEIDWNLD